MEKAQDLLISNLERLMKEKGLTDVTLAKASGMTRSGLYKIMKGHRWANSDNLTNISKALGVRVCELFMTDLDRVELGQKFGISKEVLRLVSSARNEYEMTVLALAISQIRERRKKESVEDSK